MSDTNENYNSESEIFVLDENDDDHSPGFSFNNSIGPFSISSNFDDDLYFDDPDDSVTESTMSSLSENSNNSPESVTTDNESVDSVTPIWSESNFPIFATGPIIHVPAIVNEDSIPVRDETQSESLNDNQQNEDGEPPTKCARIESDAEASDGQTCPICFDSWTSSGEHRLVSLKCGHLFGNSCIKKWLKPKENRVCPTCKSRATERDIRLIFARSVSFVDNSEVEAVKLELEKTKMAKNGVELELKCLLSKQESQKNKINELKATIDKLMKSKVTELNISLEKWHFTLVKSLLVSKQGECRVFAYNKRRNTLIMSQLNSNNIFSGCNIKELDCETFIPGKPLCVHQKEIRGLTYSDHHNLIMSVSLDKTVKILSGDSCKEAMSIPTDLALWCCSWDISEPNRICVGGLGGNILMYDIRQTKACLARIHDTRDVSPVISLASVSDNLISCSLNSLQIHTKNIMGGFDSNNQGIAGPFYDMNYNFGMKALILSMRPNATVRHCRHEIFDFDLLKQISVGESVQCYRGSNKMTQMTKSTQFQIGDNQLFSQYSESMESIDIRNINKESTVITLPCQDLIIDMCNWTRGPTMFLAGLSNSKIQIYKLCVD